MNQSTPQSNSVYSLMKCVIRYSHFTAQKSPSLFHCQADPKSVTLSLHLILPSSLSLSLSLSLSFDIFRSLFVLALSLCSFLHCLCLSLSPDTMYVSVPLSLGSLYLRIYFSLFTNLFFHLFHWSVSPFHVFCGFHS